MSFAAILKESNKEITDDNIFELIQKESDFTRARIKIKKDKIKVPGAEMFVGNDKISVTSPEGDKDFSYKDYKKAINFIKNVQKDLYESKPEDVIDTPETILRRNNFKIKSVHGTKFGTEFIFAKQYEDKDIQEILKDFKLKFDGKSVFVVD